MFRHLRLGHISLENYWTFSLASFHLGLSGRFMTSTNHSLLLQWRWSRGAAAALLPIPDHPLLDSHAQLGPHGAWALLSLAGGEDSLGLPRSVGSICVQFRCDASMHQKGAWEPASSLSPVSQRLCLPALTSGAGVSFKDSRATGSKHRVGHRYTVFYPFSADDHPVVFCFCLVWHRSPETVAQRNHKNEFRFFKCFESPPEYSVVCFLMA